jgi:hypothetical protein
MERYTAILVTTQQFGAGSAVVMLGYIVGFYFQHRDFEHLNRSVDQLQSDMTARFAEVNAILTDLKNLWRAEI